MVHILTVHIKCSPPKIFVIFEWLDMNFCPFYHTQIFRLVELHEVQKDYEFFTCLSSAETERRNLSY